MVKLFKTLIVLVVLAAVAAGLNAFARNRTLSWPIAIATMVILGTAGLLAGYFPARRAAGIDPAATLRYE